MHKPVLFNVSQAKQNNYKSILVSSFETTDMQWVNEIQNVKFINLDPAVKQKAEKQLGYELKDVTIHKLSLQTLDGRNYIKDTVADHEPPLTWLNETFDSIDLYAVYRVENDDTINQLPSDVVQKNLEDINVDFQTVAGVDDKDFVSKVNELVPGIYENANNFTNKNFFILNVTNTYQSELYDFAKLAIVEEGSNYGIQFIRQTIEQLSETNTVAQSRLAIPYQYCNQLIGMLQPNKRYNIYYIMDLDGYMSVSSPQQTVTVHPLHCLDADTSAGRPWSWFWDTSGLWISMDSDINDSNFYYNYGEGETLPEDFVNYSDVAISFIDFTGASNTPERWRYDLDSLKFGLNNSSWLARHEIKNGTLEDITVDKCELWMVVTRVDTNVTNIYAAVYYDPMDIEQDTPWDYELVWGDRMFTAEDHNKDVQITIQDFAKLPYTPQSIDDYYVTI